MDDIVGEWDEQNDCYHYSERYNSSAPLPFTLLWTGQSPGTIMSGSLCGSSLHADWPDSVLIAVPHHPSAPDASRWEVPDWSAEGWYSIYPVIKQQVGVLNSIYELKDFKRLPALYRRTRRSYEDLVSWFGMNPVRRLTRSILGIDRHGWIPPSGRDRLVMLRKLQQLLHMPVAPIFRKKRALAEILRDLSGLAPQHFLNWNFALKPLYTDLAGFAKAGRETKQKIDELLSKANGELQRGHYSRSLTADDIGVDSDMLDSDPVYLSSLASMHRYVHSLHDVRYTLSVHYSYTYSKESREIAHELGYLDSIGLSPNVGNLWRATKWTFLLDWFIRIGPMLDRLSPHLLEPVVNIHGGTHSIKYSLRTSREIAPWRDLREGNPEILWLLPENYISAIREQTVYVRKYRIPSLLGLPKTSDFSTMEKLLALALGLGAVQSGYTTG